MSQGMWTDVLADLLRTVSDDLSTQQRARRGKAFERALWRTLDEEGLRPRKGYRPQGEEIDGSFVLHGRTLLFEAKWTTGPPAASSFYEFKGKIDGKLVGTIGVYISMAGFSPDSIRALIAGKLINLILMDRADIELISHGYISFGDAVDFKLRAAAEEGTPYVPLSRGLTSTTEVLRKNFVVVESQRAVYLLTALMKGPYGANLRLDIAPEVDKVQFLVAFGRANLTKVAGAYARDFDGIIGDEIIVVDSDGQTDDQVWTDVLERSEYRLRRDSMFIVRPDLETALGVRPDWLGDYLTTEQTADDILDPSEVAARLATNPVLQKLLLRLQSMRD